MTYPLIPSGPRAAYRHRPPKAKRENEFRAGYLYDLKPRVITVIDSAYLSPSMRRLRFSANDDFDGFYHYFADEHVKLFFDKDKSGSALMPKMVFGRWSGRGLTFRDYTIRWFDPEQKWIDIDFVVHDHGVGGRWAAKARVGDQLGMLGPRGAKVIKDVFDSYVLAADETGLPALARWLETMDANREVSCYIEVCNVEHHVDLVTHADAKISWLYRNGAQPGGSTVMEQALRRHQFRGEKEFVWVAGEAQTLKPIRRYLRKDMRMDNDHLSVDGYWRKGSVNFDHHRDDTA